LETPPEPLSLSPSFGSASAASLQNTTNYHQPGPHSQTGHFGLHPQRNLSFGSHARRNLSFGSHPQRNLPLGLYPRRNLPLGLHPQRNLSFGLHPQRNLQLGSHLQQFTAFSARPGNGVATQYKYKCRRACTACH
jgi:hypothetical protein